MFCHHCGQQLPDNAQFCLRCGNATLREMLQDPIKEGESASGDDETSNSAGPDSENYYPPFFDLPSRKDLVIRAYPYVAAVVGLLIVAGVINLFSSLLANQIEHSPASSATQRPPHTPIPTSTPTPSLTSNEQLRRESAPCIDNLEILRSDWYMGGFGSVAMWNVTFKNKGNKPIGDIRYSTEYYSETGKKVDAGGDNSLFGGRVIQKVIPPGKSRRVEVNDGLTHSEAARAGFKVVDCRYID